MINIRWEAFYVLLDCVVKFDALKGDLGMAKRNGGDSLNEGGKFASNAIEVILFFGQGLRASRRGRTRHSDDNASGDFKLKESERGRRQD